MCVGLSDQILLHVCIKGALTLSLDYLGEELIGNLLVDFEILLLKSFKEEFLVLVKQLCEVYWSLEHDQFLLIKQSLYLGCQLVLELNDLVLV